jgi:hypothetical protein
MLLERYPANVKVGRLFVGRAWACVVACACVPAGLTDIGWIQSSHHRTINVVTAARSSAPMQNSWTT